MPKVLIVDDAPEIRTLLTRVLQSKGFVAISSENGEAGIEAAMQEQPELIIMDLNMPVMDGFQATMALKANDKTKHIPVLILSAEHADANREAMYEAGCDGFIAKPIDLTRLLNRISEFVSV